MDDGDEVIVHEPYFTSYDQQIKIARGIPVPLETYEKEEFQINPNRLFPTDTALMKSLYLATENATKKWTQRQRNWDQIINELSIIHS